jgi:hypothetical protein
MQNGHWKPSTDDTPAMLEKRGAISQSAKSQFAQLKIKTGPCSVDKVTSSIPKKYRNMPGLGKETDS